jgi:hypothetical protein
VIQHTPEHAFVGDANYMGDCGPLSRQKAVYAAEKPIYLHNETGVRPA